MHFFQTTEGLAQGEKQKALTIARNALQMGMSKEDTMKLTGLNENDLFIFEAGHIPAGH